MAITSITIRSVQDYVDVVSKRSGGWLFRGHQNTDWTLASSLERALNARRIALSEASGIERQLIREFKRRYEGPQFNRIQADTLYCLAVMQHHGAPTRLLDWTYSPYVAAKFALDSGFAVDRPAIFCLRTDWALYEAMRIQPSLADRSCDATRHDSSFLPNFLSPKTPQRFVYPDNSLFLNERLIVQQGVFLCPGNIGDTFMGNLRAMKGWDHEENTVKLVLRLNKKTFDEFCDYLRRMNISSASLFPGLDGAARSLNEHLFHYRYLAGKNTGDESNPEKRSVAALALRKPPASPTRKVKKRRNAE